MSEIKIDYRNFAFDNLFECNYPLRFIGVCTKQGKLLESVYRKDLVPLFSDTELQFSILKTALRSSIRDNEQKLGKVLYTVTTYEYVKRATIPLDDELLLVCSFEKNADENSVIKNILDSIKQ